MRKIQFFDTTLRDGEQSPGVNLNQKEKLQIAMQLERLGIDIIEAGFAAASPGDLYSIQAISKQCRGLSVTSLSRAIEKDIDAAWEALRDGAHPRLHLFLATSNIHMQHKLRMSRDEVLSNIESAVKYAGKYFPVIQVSAEDASRSDYDFLAQFCEVAIGAGASVINIPDTVGYSTPKEYYNLFDYLRRNVPSYDQAIFSCHCHNDLGLAVANTFAAIEGGVGQVEGTINGIGERAGNAALEEVAVGLHIRKDFYNMDTNIQLKEIKHTSSLVSTLTGMSIQKNKAVVGANAFVHESGIHQDGVLKEASTYEIISPELVGAEVNNLFLGKHSGRHALTKRLEELGYQLTTEERDRLFKAFKKLSDSKKIITDEDLHILAIGEKVTDGNRCNLKDLQVTYHSNGMQTASVCIVDEEGQETWDAATGKGSVEAIYNAIERIMESGCHLEDYRIQSNTDGEDSLAQVNVVLSKNGKKFTGFGVAYDVLEASAQAYLYGIDKIRQHTSIQKK